MATTDTPPVSLRHGQVTGFYEGKGKTAIFNGIPYARPPVGAHRWRPPEAVEPWDGVRPCRSDPPFAMQSEFQLKEFFNNLIDGQGWGFLRREGIKLLLAVAPRPPQKEDCLYLNVRTPSLDSTAKLPVMVWIHGGDHQDGSSCDIFYKSNVFCERGIVLVSINYRLGLMGYFAHPELSRESPHGVSGNYGTLDQIFALQWVRDNIASFGGNPDDITIFGESAGGESVAHMLTSPLARGLFHKAILQSPANGGQMMQLRHPFLDFPSAEETGVTFASPLVAHAEPLDALRQRSAKGDVPRPAWTAARSGLLP